MILFRRRKDAVVLLRVDPSGKRRKDIGVAVSVLAPGSANLAEEQARFDKAKERVLRIGGDAVNEGARFDAGRMALLVDDNDDDGRHVHHWGGGVPDPCAAVRGLSYSDPFDIVVKRSDDGTIKKRWKEK